MGLTEEEIAAATDPRFQWKLPEKPQEKPQPKPQQEPQPEAEQSYEQRCQQYSAQLPAVSEMPPCPECGIHYLVFRDTPPVSDSDIVTLVCPGCGALCEYRHSTLSRVWGFAPQVG